MANMGVAKRNVVYGRIPMPRPESSEKNKIFLISITLFLSGCDKQIEYRYISTPVIWNGIEKDANIVVYPNKDWQCLLKENKQATIDLVKKIQAQKRTIESCSAAIENHNKQFYQKEK